MVLFSPDPPNVTLSLCHDCSRVRPNVLQPVKHELIGGDLRKRKVVRYIHREEGSRKQMDEQVWQKMSIEILMDLKEWRRANPRATYVQIEEEVHKRVMQLEARLIQEAAEESPSREWGRGSEHEAALCPKCATPLQARGKQKRTDASEMEGKV